MVIPNQLKELEFRFILIKPKLKAPFEYNWQNKNNYVYNCLNVINHQGNLGIVAGYGGLIILDIDDKKLIEEFENKLDTFTVKTGSGGRHFYLICNEHFGRKYYVLKDKVGELRVSNSQVVIPDSIHPNGKRYEVIKDITIQKITKKNIRELLGDLLSNEGNSTDTSRSGQEWREVCEMVEGGYNFEEVDRELRLLGYTKWIESPQDYRLRTYCGAVQSMYRKQ